MLTIMGAVAGVFVATISSMGAVEVAAGAEVAAGPVVDAGVVPEQPTKAAVETRTIDRTNNNVFFILTSLFMTFICSGYFYTISSPQKGVSTSIKQNIIIMP